MTKSALLLMILLAARPARGATVEASTLVRHYDDGETRVTSPSLDVDTVFNNDRMKFGVGVANDILTSASSDVRTYSSKGQIEDNRLEFSSAFETAVPDGTMGFGYTQSDEVDYSSRIVSASATREFFQKNTVIGFGFSNGQDRIGDASDPMFEEPMNHQVYSLSLTQVLSRQSIVQFLYDFRVESGYVMSPYRKAKVKDATGAIQPSLPENHPRTRNRNALAVKYNYFSQPLDISFATTYRFYFDSWEVRSHTLEERISKEFGKRWSLSLILRYYMQSKASFFQDYYEDGNVPPFRTGNTTLSTYNSVLAGLRPQYNISSGFGLYMKYEYYLQTFQDVSDAGLYFDANDDKKLKTNAQVVGLGLNMKF
ncbi:MAG: DUF3570 domain-containing protein [Bdellovibrionaceae bacterium]|nr:DUF3570 domain-containing protein [Pseudobdellovibrionaceae bacterium]